jgi:2-iminobutanoate/2-iminopropanoate deaminase
MKSVRSLLACLVLALAVPVAAAPKKTIHPKEFPTGRPFSPGILVGDTLYVAGQTGNDLKTGQIPEDFEAEVKQTLENIALVLKEAGMTFDNAVAVQVYLTDMTLFPRMNAIYTTYFKEPRPARTTVGIAKLVGTARIEITVTASK